MDQIIRAADRIQRGLPLRTGQILPHAVAQHGAGGGHIAVMQRLPNAAGADDTAIQPQAGTTRKSTPLAGSISAMVRLYSAVTWLKGSSPT